MASLGNFNADDHKDTFTPLPAGHYTAMIVKSDTVTTKAGTGSYLKLEIDIVDGEYKGRKLFSNLNLVNPNAQAVSIAKTELANICRAVGVLHPKDSQELHFKPVSIRVTIKPEEGQYPATNEVKGWEAIGNTPAAPVEQKPVKPWEKPASAQDE